MTRSSVVRQVVRYLGIVAIVALVGTIWLISRLITQGAGKGTIDPGSVALIVPPSNIAAAALAALGSLLVSTRGGEEPPTPVQVVNEPEDAVPVEDAE